MYACVFLPRPADDARGALTRLAQEFSPRYELPRPDLVTIDVRGLDRLLGPPSVIGAEIARDAAARGLRVQVALAPAFTAAAVLVLARPGVTVVDAGTQAAALAPLPIGILNEIGDHDDDARRDRRDRRDRRERDPKGNSAVSAVSALKQWGVRTLGELAALPAADLAARLGRGALAWQAVARGDDTRPLVPALPEERFDA